MFKFSGKLLILALSLGIGIYPLLVQAEEDSSTTTTPPEKPSILQAIISLFRAPENRFISRGDSVCLISPSNSQAQLVWSDRPLFAWQGEMAQGEINLYAVDNNSKQLIWTETISSRIQTIAYTGKQLQPGFTYDWELMADGESFRHTIELMPQPQREAISDELITITKQLPSSDTTAEELARARADYFVSQKLGYDALQELYSVENPSTELAQEIADIEDYLCNSTMNNEQ
ncbi:MAG: hypothetical protein AAFQ80_20535 [Cyanobacteria bacterium J06621_8]